LSFTLAPEALLRHEHLQYEQLTHYLDSDIDAEGREILDLHLRACEPCREDLQSLREFRRQIAPEMSVSYAPSGQVQERKVARPAAGWFGWLKPAYAAAAVVVLVIALLATISLRDRSAVERQAQILQPASGDKFTGSEKSPAGAPQTTANDNAASAATVAQASSNSGNITPPAVMSPRNTTTQARATAPEQRATRGTLHSTVTVAELNDGGQKITVDRAGNVTGLDHLTPTEAQLVKETLLAQNMSRPAELAELAGAHGALRGSPDAGQSFRLLSPARTVTAADRPTFKWESMPGATSYRVYVGDLDNREAASSGELSSSSTEWTSGTSLQRGRVYTWVVIAKVNGGDVIAPAASQSEMKFKVLSADALRELTKLQHSERSHLMMGMFYVRSGMLEEAEHEFAALVRLNPKSPVALKLLRTVQSWR
jgi:anti-sigma factor RsiW